RCGDPLADCASLAQSRHSLHLGHCVEELGHYGHECQRDLGLAAERLRVARRHLGRITGQVGTEDLLDVIFRDFCIGK
ncbi:GTPB3 GTPase, partial [Upupa epops]|nr:GTPB3 GTPase [Upupa epops]